MQLEGYLCASQSLLRTLGLVRNGCSLIKGMVSTSSPSGKRLYFFPPTSEEYHDYKFTWGSPPCQQFYSTRLVEKEPENSVYLPEALQRAQEPLEGLWWHFEDPCCDPIAKLVVSLCPMLAQNSQQDSDSEIVTDTHTVECASFKCFLPGFYLSRVQLYHGQRGSLILFCVLLVSGWSLWVLLRAEILFK